MIKKELIEYVEDVILPKYDNSDLVDVAHKSNHIRKVIRNSIEIILELDLTVDMNMVYIVASYHDLGLTLGDREDHHINSGKLLRDDIYLKDFFSDEEIEVMVEAVEDHRASLRKTPRNIYGEVVSDADRCFDEYILRSLQYHKFDYESSFNYIRDRFNSFTYHIKGKVSARRDVLKMQYNMGRLELILDVDAYSHIG